MGASHMFGSVAMPSNPGPDRDEQFEHIPWEHLQERPDHRRLIYALAATILVAGLVAALVRSLGQAPDRPEVAPAGALAPTPTAPPDPTIPAASTPTTVDTVTTDRSRVWSEADLMAVAPETLAGEAAAMAEWVAADFFTVDGGPERIAHLERELPPGSATPIAAEGQRSFVESTRAMSAVEIGPATYRVLVVVRRLGAEAGEPYVRLPPAAILVDLAWTTDGWSLRDLPALAEPPRWVPAPAWSEDEVPSQVVSALAALGGESLSGSRVGEDWRVVAGFTDLAGIVWPLVVWFDADGNRLERAIVPGVP
ncbi:MAG TPA: hypothetical protein VLA54_11500 [Acidimicrobiia bacterium]|nr:hypothetical protein [Acidimicrobiia bacterium]